MTLKSIPLIPGVEDDFLPLNSKKLKESSKKSLSKQSRMKDGSV